VFDHGRIVEDGSHADLMRLQGGLYRRLVEHQTDRLDAGLAAA
jgi:ATP-binding cassette subfamily B protein